MKNHSQRVFATTVCAVAMTLATVVDAQAQTEVAADVYTSKIVDFATKSTAWRYVNGLDARDTLRFIIDDEVGETLSVPYQSASIGRPEPFVLRLLNTRFSFTNGSWLRIGTGRRKGSSLSIQLTY